VKSVVWCEECGELWRVWCDVECGELWIVCVMACSCGEKAGGKQNFNLGLIVS